MTLLLWPTHKDNILLKELTTNEKHFGDGLSILMVAGTLTNYLPSIAAILTIIWTVIRIFETDTVQKFLNGEQDDKNS